MEKQTDVVIIGGGAAGLCLGILLAQKAVSVDLVEPFPAPPLSDVQPSGRSAALFGSSIDLIQETGIWETLALFCEPLRTMKIIDNDAQSIFSSEEIGRDLFGYNVPNGPLRACLHERAMEIKTLTLHALCSLESFESDGAGVSARLDNGTGLRAPLLIGADGRNSAVRGTAGVQTQTKDYGQSALTFLIKHERPHNSTASEFHKPGGPLALVPMPGDCSAVVWVEKTEDAQSLLTLKKHELSERVTYLSSGLLGPCEIVTPVQSWPLAMIAAKSLIGERMALIAEAAHVMPPISAQGLNLSLRDIRDLRDLILQTRRVGLDIGSSTMLNRYDSLRRPDMKLRQMGIDFLNRSVMTTSTAGQKTRRLGLQATSHFTLLKRLLMREGMKI